MTTDRDRVALLLRAMFVRAHSIVELMAISGFSDRTVREWIKTMHDAGIVYIARYERTTVFYRCGLNVADAVRPSTMTNAEKQAAHRRRKARRA